MKRIPMTTALVLVAGCGERGAPQPSPAPTAKARFEIAAPAETADPRRSNRTTYDEIRGGNALKKAVSLCYLLKFYDAGAGAYRVKSITGYTEELLAFPGHFDGFTYIELDLVTDWSGNAPANPVVRIAGGPKDAQITRGWDIGAKVGEVIGLLLEAPRADNRGYFGVEELTVFRQSSKGGFTNGQLFARRQVPLDVVGHAVEKIVRLGASCANADVLPDLGGSAAAITPNGLVPLQDGGVP
jgi:hypothetical protein